MPQPQFILHNIFFDYSNWALSGVYQTSLCANASQTSAAQPDKPVSATSQNPSQNKQADGTVRSNSPATNTSNVDRYIMCTKPGQVATIGAIDIQDEVTEDSVFSKRNLVINGLTLVGQVAGGYAFVGSTAAVQV